MAKFFDVNADHPDAASNNPSESFSFKQEHKHPNEVKPKKAEPPKPPKPPKPPGPPKPPDPPKEKPETENAQDKFMPENLKHQAEQESKEEHGEDSQHQAAPVDGHEQDEGFGQVSHPPERLGGERIKATGHGPISHLVNIVSDTIHEGRQRINDHHARRADNMSQKAANLGHIADTHHTMANEYEKQGQHDLAVAARRRGDQALVKHDKASKIANKNFGKMFKADQRNNAEAFNQNYHQTRAMTTAQRSDAKNLASLHSAHINGYRPQSQEESNANKALKNRVMSNVVNRTNAVKAHDNFEHPLDRVTPKMFNNSKHKNATTTMQWKAPSGNKSHNLSYSPSKEPGFSKPHMSDNLAF